MASKNSSQIGSSKSKSATDSTVADSGPPQTVDQIRDLIFGSQMRNYEHRFEILEQQVRSETAALRDDLLKRVDRVAKQAQLQLTKESEARLQNVKSLTSSLAETASKVGSEGSRDRNKIREEVAAEFESSQRALEKTRDELLALIDKRTHGLQQQKVDRSVMSQLLFEVATTLANEEPAKPNKKPVKRRSSR
jgi:hypothetical protein